MLDTLFLLSSDIRSEGSIAIVKKFDLDFLMIFYSIVHQSHSLKMCFRKNVCVCVCLSVADRRAQTNRPISFKFDIWGPLVKISSRFFSFPLPLKLRVVYIGKEIKISIFQKMALTIFIKFCEFIVHSKTNNITLSAFPGKSLKQEKQFLIFCPSSNVAPKLSDQSRSHSISRIPLQISAASFFHFRSTLKIKGSSH